MKGSDIESPNNFGDYMKSSFVRLIDRPTILYLAIFEQHRLIIPAANELLNSMYQWQVDGSPYCCKRTSVYLAAEYPYQEFRNFS